jgi:hypothetical protein
MNQVTFQEQINALPDNEKSQISDGYHTFDELYEHRCVLWICLVNQVWGSYHSYGLKLNLLKSKKHHDGTSFDGWFLSCLIDSDGRQMSYHLPMKYWDRVHGEAFEQCPNKFDGHTPKDVLDRLLSLYAIPF